MRLISAVGRGIKNGFKTGGMLLKIVLPVYLIVVIVKYSPVMPWLEKLFNPVMKLFNLPGDAAIALITGFFTDEYGCVAAMGGLSFSTGAITTIAMVNLMLHSMPVESALAQKIGFTAWRVIVLRLAMAVLVGIGVGWLGGLMYD